ncbi:rhodanese-like domain-containing protein [Gramella jeungdoensis]|uniref:Rhodanese-like domain-containing protein n=1 Tax=Gramella jeungdoensis TaxID=708091 RepID=A0ABT0Z3B5_9FLAO|nr:rhodanese-like domain-containing protein [Gramella jeungdoensis]MCM8570024.1 rhodanese-like domain-containing protein [Gramella jeungdoensis]
MLKILKKLFNSNPEPDYSELLKNNGIILDVRTKNEYAIGHIKGSKNIPLNSLTTHHSKLTKKDQPIITCCASGMRSANAKRILKNLGYTNVHNGGGWRKLHNKL